MRLAQLAKLAIQSGLTFAILLISFHVQADTPAAERSKQAAAIADQAYAAYQREDWPRAVALYLESYKLVQTAEVLFNIATLYDRKLGDKQLAVDYYRKHNASPDATTELVGKAIGRIAELTRNHSNEAAVPTQASPPATPANRRQTFRVAGLVTGLIGVAGLGVGIGFGVDAMNKANDAKAAGCASGKCPDAASGQKEQSAFTSGTVSTVGIVIGAALVVVGVTLVLVAPKKEAPKAASLRLSPSLGWGQVGFGLTGTM